MIINSHQRRLRLTEEKFGKLMNNLLEVLAWTSPILRIASKILGRLVSYSECVQPLLVFSVQFTVFIGVAKSNEAGRINGCRRRRTRLNSCCNTST